MSVLAVECKPFDSPELLTVFAGPAPTSKLEAVAMMPVMRDVNVSAVKLQTLPLTAVESGGALTLSTRQ